MSGSNNNTRATIALALVSVIWGYNWVAMKRGVSHAGSFQFAAPRLVLASALLVPVGMWMRAALWPARSQWKPILILGVALAGNFGGCFTPLELGGAGMTAVLVYTMPFWVPIFAHLTLRESVSRWQGTPVGMVILGLVVQIEPWDL